MTFISSNCVQHVLTVLKGFNTDVHKQLKTREEAVHPDSSCWRHTKQVGISPFD